MKKTVVVISLLYCLTLCCHADYVADTIRADQLIEQFDSSAIESMMLDLLQKQAIEIAHRNDSIHQWRLQNDTTTLNPFHIGYRDSILMAVDRTEQQFYLRQAGLYTQPQIWRKHYMFSTKASKAYMFDEPLDSDMKLKKAGGMLILVKQNDYLTPEESDITTELSTVDVERSWAPELEQNKKIVVRSGEQKKWYKEATVLLQITQNYVTKNWYTGGSSNFAVLGIVTGKIDYNDFKHMTWENTLEWRAGAGTNSADTLRKISTTEDLFRLYSKFNYKAASKIYYSVSAEFITQFFDTYKETNSTTLVTSLFTPIRFNLNAGMDFKPIKGLSIALSPLSYKYVYVRDTARIAQTNFSVPQGKRSLNEIGSSLRVEYTYKPFRELAVEGKLYFYTNYHKVEIDMEVTANIIFSQYFSARVNLHPRYDNTVILSGDEKAKLQFKEFVSVGFTHRFR